MRCRRSQQKEDEPEFDDTDAPIVTASQQDQKPAILSDKKLVNFIWTTAPQPHAVRRRYILEKYPEIEQLYGYDRRYAYQPFISY